MRKAKSIESFTNKRYGNTLFLQFPIGLKLYKSTISTLNIFTSNKNIIHELIQLSI